MHTDRKRFFLASLLGILMLLPVPALITACQEEPVVVDITLEAGMNGLADALRRVNATLEEKLAAIESAFRDGYASDKNLQELISAALSSLSGTMSEKLAAIEAAVQGQTTSLETKLALIEAAVQDGFAAGAVQQDLLQQAIASMGGTLAEKLAAVEQAIKAQTTSLETKIGLIEAAVKEGLADSASAGDLIKEAIESLGGTLSEKTSAVEKAISSQTTALSAKLGLIETALKEGFAGKKTQRELIKSALESLSGSAEEKLADVEEALISQTSGLETKLGLIEAALKEGFTDEKTQQELIKSALESLGGTVEDKLDAVQKAVSSQTSGLETKLGLIETAVKESLADGSAAQELIKKALEALEGTVKKKLEALEKAVTSQTSGLDTHLGAIEQAVTQGFTDSKGQQELIKKAVEGLGDKTEDVLGKLQEAMVGKLSNLDSKLKALAEAVKAGFAGTNETLGLINSAISAVQNGIASAGTSVEAVKTALTDLVKAIQALDKTMSEIVASALTDILEAIANQPDYSALLQEILAAIEEFIPVTVTFDKYVLEESGEAMLNMPEAYTLDVPYTLSSDSEISVTATDDVKATVTPDSGNPLKGVISIVSPATIEDGKSEVEVMTKNTKRTLHIGKAKMERISSNRVDIRHEGGVMDFRYKTNVSVTISVHDTCDWARPVWGVASTKSAMADSVIHVLVDPNNGTGMRRTNVTARDIFGVNSVTFYVYQEYNANPIVFADANMKQYLLDNKKVNLNGDNEISEAEAAAVKSLETLFGTGLTEGRDCRRFKEFQYFTGITEIPDGSFNHWAELDSIILPESINTFKTGYGDCEGIFQDCPKLKSIDGKFTQNNAIVYNKQLLRVAPNVVYDGQFIPDGVEIIGSKAVRHSITTDLYIPSSVRKLRDRAFEYSSIAKVRFAMTTDDPATGTAYVDSLAEDAFNHCFSLTQFIGPTKNGSLRVTPDNLGLCRDTTLYAYALGSDATSFIIPDEMDVRRLAHGVFDSDGGATSLKEIGLPSTLTHIRDKAFGSQADISLYFRGVKPPKVDPGAFGNTSPLTITIYVPAVMNGTTVDTDATNERIVQFETAMGMGNNHFIFKYYTE